MRPRQVLFDVGIALVVFLLTLGLLRGRGDGHLEIDALGLSLAAVSSLPLVARRRAPLAVFAITAGASVLLTSLEYPPGPPLGATVALYTLALGRARLWPAGAVVVGFFVAHVGADAVVERTFPGGDIVFGTLLWGGAWLAGERTRLRRERIAALEERALRAERDAERERELAAAEERTRIARDLHDSAGHAINVILVQAGAARVLREQDPERSRAALETVEEVARDTLAEIDQLVRALRDDASAEEIEPPPGLAALEALVDRHRAAGLAVTVRVDGSRRLAASVDRTAYRILQEALTNASRHGTGSAEVDVSFGAEELELEVTNPVGAPAAGGGHGIVGMRERAALLGGRLETGAADGVFRVRAGLPYGEGGA